MAAGTLTSDHVNYLIWRYLQESGHGEAAVKLQRDWTQDPQSLPFADNVKTHALVSLIQKGLQYHEVERSLKDSRSQLHASATALFFGTTAVRTQSSSGRDDLDSDGATLGLKSRKTDRHHDVNGLGADWQTSAPAAKRHRRGNGPDLATNGDAMQIDQNGYHEHADGASPTNHDSSADDAHAANGMDIDEPEGDAPVTPTPEPVPTLAHGQSVGIQSEKAVDLTSKADILTLSSPTQVLMHMAWNPRDANVLATAGEALCRIWHLTKSASLGDSPYHDILPHSDDSLASTMAWSPDGEILAVATRNAQSSDWVGAVSLWTKHGKAVEELPATQEMVIMLRWNAAGTRLLGITSSGERSSSVVVWEISSSQPHEPCQVDSELRDASWVDDTRFVVSGRGVVATSFYPSPGQIALEHHQDKAVATKTWTSVRHDSATASTLCAAEEDGALIRLSSYPGMSDTKLRQNAHADQITALELHPLSSTPLNAADGTKRILATSSVDGTTKIWSAPALDLLNVLSLSSSTPVFALSFSPDGNLLAAANHTRISIWSPTEQGPPKATWKGELGRMDSRATAQAKKANPLTNGNGALAANHEHPAPDRDSAVGDLSEEDSALGCSLSWDMDGQRLAMGVGSQIAIVNLTP